MQLFSEDIDKFIGKTVKVYVDHKIYGKQKIVVRKFQPLCNVDKVGFVINDREFYVCSDEIENIEADDSAIYIYGTVQNMIIQIMT